MAHEKNNRIRQQLKISIHQHTLYFKKPAITSRDVMQHRKVWYVTLQDEEMGRKGIGECAPIFGLGIEDERTLLESIKHLEHSTIVDPDEFTHLPSLRFALESALADLNGPESGVLFPSEFTKGLKAIPINGLVWMNEKDTMLQEALDKARQGYTCIKFKVGSIEFADEVEMLVEFRRNFPQVEIRLDANGAFGKSDVFKKMEQLATLNVHSIEQPVSPLKSELLSELSKQDIIPVALDESLIGIFEPDRKMQLLERIKPRYLVLKPSLLGGFETCSEWIKLAAGCNTGYWITSALESNVGLNAIAQWTANLPISISQGLGTGLLYKENTPTRLKLMPGFLWFDQIVN